MDGDSNFWRVRFSFLFGFSSFLQDHPINDLSDYIRISGEWEKIIRMVNFPTISSGKTSNVSRCKFHKGQIVFR